MKLQICGVVIISEHSQRNFPGQLTIMVQDYTEYINNCEEQEQMINIRQSDIAKQLNSRKTNTIGIVIPDLENSFFSYIVDSMIDYATENDYRVILTVSREKESVEKRNIENLIGMRVDGLLVCNSQETGLSIPSDIGIFGYGFSEITDFFDPQLTVINQDPRKMGQLAAKVLIDEIAGVHGSNPVKITIEEEFLWKESLKRTNVK